MRLYCCEDGWWAEREGRYARLGGFDVDAWLAADDPAAMLARCLPAEWGADPALRPGLPIAGQEVWAAGVTYLRSKSARMEESDFSATAYDRVYEADRPEIFFKATASRCVGHAGRLRLREDSAWMVPEPELALLVNHAGVVAGFTIGDDLSCRDIEGQNLLYLPQAKTWHGCCALGPCIATNEPGLDARAWAIAMEIRRGGRVVFDGQTNVGRIKRSFDELIGYLFRHQSFPRGVVLLTGTGIVPPEGFTLQRGDEVTMRIDGIGTLVNTME